MRSDQTSMLLSAAAPPGTTTSVPALDVAKYEKSRNVPAVALNTLSTSVIGDPDTFMLPSSRGIAIR